MGRSLDTVVDVEEAVEEEDAAVSDVADEVAGVRDSAGIAGDYPNQT